MHGWVVTATVDHYNLVQAISFNAEMRNGVDTFFACVGKRSTTSLPAPKDCCAVQRQGLKPTCKHSAATYLTMKTIPLRFLCLHYYKRLNWGFWPPPPHMVVDHIKMRRSNWNSNPSSRRFRMVWHSEETHHIWGEGCFCRDLREHFGF